MQENPSSQVLQENASAVPIQNPPDSILGSFKFLGPGFILSAAIVGSGELIATTALGAKAGFALLWIIILGCLIKVAIQLEYGRFCIMHGKRTYEAWNAMPGLRIGPLHWSLCLSIFFMISIFFGQAGVIGASAQVTSAAFPILPVWIWVYIIALVIALILSFGKYKAVETIAMLLNVTFIATLLYCVMGIQSTDYAFTHSDISSGLMLAVPAGTLAFALAAFGITGVSSGEIAMYPYWCIEKGYAAWTGPNDDSDEWVYRAKGWMRVMTLDAIVSLIAYTVATIAFYILGAAILSKQDMIADGNQLIVQLSQIFTEILGAKVYWVFMAGALAVLFSTSFSNVAAYSRLWTDFFSECGFLSYNNEKIRWKWIKAFACILPILWATIYITIQKPLFLVIIMGVSNTMYLLVVAYQGILFRYRHTDKRLIPSKFYDAAFWLSVASILYVAIRSIIELF